MALALVGSVFVHTMLLTIQPVQSTLGLRFASADLDVILVNSQSPRKVSAADALAKTPSGEITSGAVTVISLTP